MGSMFILYAVVIGIALGLLLRGRLEGIADIEFRWAPLILGGLLVQIVLFSDPVAERVGVLGPSIYVLSSLAVLVGVLRNLYVPGMVVVALGAASNQLAIVANGGFMPAGADALAAQERAASGLYSNSAAIANPAFPYLTDIFAMPTWMPFSNIFSVGDLLIGIGVVIVLVRAMRRAARMGELTAGSGTSDTPAGASGNLPQAGSAD
jgi:hypothetical protein